VRAFAALLVLACPAPVVAQAVERIAEIRVHGNHTTPDGDVLALSGLAVGDEASDARLEAAAERIRSSRRFEGVDVRRRFLSIEDPTAILVMVVVDEHPAVTADDPTPGPWRRLRFASMWLPVLSYADGYGLTYGVRFSFVDPLGRDTRISVPLTWGGERRAAVEIERTFGDGLVSRVMGSAGVYRRVNPFFDTPDLRYEARGRVERRLRTWLRVGAAARTARVEFSGTVARHSAGGVDVELDTRLDPSFPRNAIHASAGWERMAFEQGSASRLFGDLRGYVGIGGARVLALRAQFSHANAALPPSEQALLGGSGSLRGYRTGYRVGDSLAALSAEVRVPLTSPLRIGRFGVKGFVDTGTTWPSGARLADQQFDHGIGAGVYAGIAVFMIDVDVAWPESGSPRAHVGMGVSF
jgi:outer membrane protein assembly factor BamA